MDIFGDLSYNNKAREFVGRPVDDIHALYKKKDADYNYVVDATNNIKNALSSVKYNPKNKDRVIEASSKVQSVLGDFAKTGDYENKILETKTLANDLANNFGLKAVTDDYNKEQQYKAQLDKALEEGTISRDRYKQYLIDASENYKGVAKDEELGTYVSTFTGRSPVQQTDWGKELVDLANGWKANTIPLTTAEGKEIVSDSNGKGYIMNNGTKEYVGEAEVANALKTYLKSNPNYQSEVNEDLYFEYSNNFKNPETGEIEKPSIQDIKNIARSGVSSDITNMFKSTNEEQLLEELKKKGLDTSDLYNMIRMDQKMNNNIRVAVDKESYHKYNLNYVKDWLLEARMDKGTSQLQQEFGMTSTWYTDTKLRSEDLERNSELSNNTALRAKQLEEDILLNGANMHPNRLQEKEAELRSTKIAYNKTKERFSDFINSEDAQRVINKIKESPDEYLNGQYIGGRKLEEYANIAPAKLNDLISKAMDGTLKDEDLTIYAKEDATVARKSMAANSIRREIESMADAIKTSVENNEIAYTKDFTEISLPEMKAEDRRNNPTHQFVTQLDNLVKTGSNYYNMLGDIKSDLPIKDIIEEQEDVKSEDGEILWNKATLIPSYDNDIRPDGTSYSNVLRLTVPILKDNKEVLKTYAVRSADDGVNTKFKEVIQDQRNSLMTKSLQAPLKESEKKILDALNLNMYQDSPYGTELDLVDWYSKGNKEVTKVNFWEQDGKPLSAYIKTFNHSAPSDMSHYLVDKEGNYYTRNITNGNMKKLSENDLYLPENREYKAIGGNTVKDLKQVLANQISNSVNFGLTPPSSKNLFNVSTVYGADVKNENTLPFLDGKYYQNNIDLKSDYPSLYITDAFRTPNSTVGSPTSNHKEAKALDFRYNADAIRLSHLSKEQLAKYNIKSAEVHGQGTENIHVHIEFN